MVSLQTDLIEIYNTLVIFNDQIMKDPEPKPLQVWYDEGTKSLAFETQNKSVRIPVLNHYCLDLEELQKKTYLLPEDYDILMYTLQKLINSGELLKDRTCLSPENWGFNIFTTNPQKIQEGPNILGKIRFISGKGAWFRFWTKHKYGL